jgi:hypothetical protein
MTVILLHLPDQTNHYRFWARTLREAQYQMEHFGPSDTDGRHAASCDVQAGIIEGLHRGIVPGSTQRIPELGSWTSTALITQGELRYRANYLYPQWVNAHLLPQHIQAEWRRFRSCIIAHERGHLRISMPLLEEYWGQFESLRIASSGSSANAAETAAKDELLAQVRELYAQLSFRCSQANQSYDLRSRHGRTQGAQLRIQPTVRRARRQ